MSESTLARLGLLGVGGALLHICSDIWNRVGPFGPGELFFLVCIWLCLLGGLGMMACAFLSSRPQRFNLVQLVALLMVQWVLHASFAVERVNNNAPSDTVILSLHAGVLNWLGYNPYGYPMHDASSAFDATGQAMTPHLDGGHTDILPYPSLHFLALTPVLPWGLEGARFFYSLSFSLLLVTLFFYAPSRFRGVVLLPIVLNPEFMHYPLYWSSDSVWTLLLALTLCAWSSVKGRAILFGLACAFKQTPWLFAPYLAVRLLREEDKPWKSLATFTGLSFATFAVLNAPYAVADFGAWFQGTFDPMLSPYISLGKGISTLTQSGLAGFPKSYYLALTLLTFVCTIAWYLLDYPRLRPLLWMFPAVVLFFSYRSLQHYFIYSVPLLLMELSHYEFQERERHRLWFLPPALNLTGLALATLVFWPSPSGLKLEVLETGPRPSGISWSLLRLTNSGDRPIQPTFFARTGWRTYPWEVVEGPLTLTPGESGRYTVATDLNYRTVNRYTGGQILVEDGESGRYLAVAQLDTLESLEAGRGFDSPPGLDWVETGNVSYRDDVVSFSTQEGAEESTVTRFVTLPFSDLSFEMYLPETLPARSSVGVDLKDDHGRRLTVILGATQSQGFYDPEHFYKTIPGKPGWNRYRLDLRELYQASGFPLPSVRRIIKQDVELIDRGVTLSFFLYSPTPASGPALRNVALANSTAPGHRIADLLTHRADYEAVLGDFAARKRHFEEAMEHYHRAEPLGEDRIRSTQEGSFLVFTGPLKMEGRFPLAGRGWGEPEVMEGKVTRPIHGLVSSVRMLAQPGLNIELQFSPETPFYARWNGEPWQKMEPGETMRVPEPLNIHRLSVIPEEYSGLSGIIVSEAK